MTKRWPLWHKPASDALVSPRLCDSLRSIINTGSHLLLDQSLSGFQSHCQFALCLWCMDVFWSRWLLVFLSCQQLWWKWGLRFLLQSQRGRPHCWSPLRAPAWSLRPPALLYSPLEHRDNIVQSDHFILKSTRSATWTRNWFVRSCHAI